MIISRTPLRMSFVGGGSDLPSFYKEHGGAVVSTAVDKYVYITVNKKFDDQLRISYSKTEEVDSVDKIEHKIVRECLKLLKLTGGLEITSIADVPSRGTGLGSSSAFTVGLLHALHAFNRQFVSAEKLAHEACQIEIDICKEPIGKQDQYASAFGGLNFIQFNKDGSVFVDPIICSEETKRLIEKNTLVFYTGIARSASELLRTQEKEIRASASKQQTMQQMVGLAHDLRKELQSNRLDSFGEILHENWELKKSLATGVSNDQIEQWYQKARSAGALGGKLLGAGAGGFLMFYVKPEKQVSVRQALSPLREEVFHFEPQGSKIIFVH